MKNSIRFRVFERDGFTCVYCGRKAPEVTLEADHKHPRSKGGADTIENLVTSCHECNRGKAARVIVTDDVSLQRKRAADRKPPCLRGWVLVPKPCTDRCEDCGQPLEVWWLGQILDEPSPGVLRVQWHEWGFGEDTYQELVTVADVVADEWRLFDDEDHFYAVCRGVLTKHDHMRRMSWASYGQSEPPRVYITHPFANAERARG